MKLLLIHADYIEWQATKKALKTAPDSDKDAHKVEEVLVVFTAVEKNDEKNPAACAKHAISDIVGVAEQIKAQNIVVYPYAHLSSDLGKPSVATEVMNLIEKGLKTKKYSVERAPFGWYKEFNIKTKGHPLSELSRTIDVEQKEKDENVSEAVKKESVLKSTWYILEPSGKMHKLSLQKGSVSGFNFAKHKKLHKLAHYEMAKSREVKEQPPHISLMKKLGLVGYEPGSDPGNLRFPPKGRLMKSLIEDYVTRKTIEYGGMEVETPIMYDVEHPSLKSYLNRFPARQYNIHTPNKDVFLRFSACFGQFLMAHDAGISYKDLPFRIYELTRYSFRVEQHGELAGLRRLRAFTMPDCHALVKDFDMAKKEMKKRMDLSLDIQKDLGFSIDGDFEFALRSVKDFFDTEKPFIMDLVKKWGRPILLELWDDRFFYFVLKYEFNFIDALDKAAALTTDQIDVENGERYGIQYQDSDNVKKHPLILHLSPSGAVERVIYAMLEKKYMEQKDGKNPTFPLWLSPTQIRLCPMNDELVSFSEKIMKELAQHNIRVDLDDRAESTGKKVRDAEMEWVPYIVVIGEKEKKSGKFAVRFRETGKVHNLTAKELAQKVTKDTQGFPFKELPLPKKLSKRPVFVA